MKADLQELVAALGALPALQECDVRELRRLAAAGRAVRLPAGWSVVQEQTPGDCCYLIVSGSVQVTVSGAAIADLGPGAVFGEVALLDARLRNATVTTQTPTRVLAVAAGDLRRLLERQPHLADVLLTDYRRRAGVSGEGAAMWSSIVVGTDGSPTAQEAVRQAAALATLTGARLSIVNAYRPVSTSAALAMTGAGVGLLVDSTEILGHQLQEAEELLEHAVMSLGTAGTAPHTFARPGNPAEVLLQVAADVDADLIIVGNRGMQGAQRFLLGSVPNRVAHHASCSVLVVHTT